MSEEKNKWVEAVAKMIQLTQEGKLRWRAVHADESLKQRKDDIIDIVFLTKLKNQNIRLYKRIYMVEGINPGSIAALLQPFNTEARTASHREAEILLELIGENDLNLWTFPEVNVLPDLLSAVHYQAAGVKDFINNLMTDNVGSDKDE